MNTHNVRNLGRSLKYFLFLAPLLLCGCNAFPDNLHIGGLYTDSGVSEKDGGGEYSDNKSRRLGSPTDALSMPSESIDGGELDTNDGDNSDAATIDRKRALPDAGRLDAGDDARRQEVDSSVDTQQEDSGIRPVCGNGLREADEECDSDDTCGADCKWLFTPEQRKCIDNKYLYASMIEEDKCNVCMCTNCMDATKACYASESQDLNEKCTDVVLCGNRNHCVGPACYTPFTCLDTVTRVTSSVDVALLLIQMIDPSTALGRATTVGNCLQTVCKDPCGW